MLERIFPSITLRRERMHRQIAEEIAVRKAAEAAAESIPTFARDNDEDQWRTSSSGREPLDYSQHDLEDMWEASLELSYHPGGRGLLDAMESFVIGDSMKVLAQDENPKVQEYWDDWAKLNNWEWRSKEMFRRFIRDGEIFLRWFKPAASEELTTEHKKHKTCRFIEPNEIKSPANDLNGTYSFGIKTDPEDVEKVLEYHREYTVSGTQKEETIAAEEIDHFKHGVDSNVKRGRSWLMGVAKYIRMHEQWLDRRYELNQLRNLFAVIGNIKGIGSSDVANVKAKFADTTGKAVSGEGTPKKMPKNAMVLLQKGIDWQMQPLNVNASDAAEDGRNFQLLIAAGTGLTEYIVRGDASNASYSSTMVSESPMVRMFQKYQDLMRYMQQIVFARVIKYGIETGQLDAKSTKTIEGQLRNAKRKLRAAVREGRMHLMESVVEQITLLEAEKEDPKDPKNPDDDPKNQDEPDDEPQEPPKPPMPPAPPEPKKETVPTSTECQVEFPPLIHRDIQMDTTALVLQRNQGWVSDQTASTSLGYDYEQERREIQKAEYENAVRQRGADKDQGAWS